MDSKVIKKPIHLEVAFDIGERVFHVIGPEDAEGIVTGYVVRPGKQILYLINWRSGEEAHYDFEITNDKYQCS